MNTVCRLGAPVGAGLQEPLDATRSTLRDPAGLYLLPGLSSPVRRPSGRRASP